MRIIASVLMFLFGVGFLWFVMHVMYLGLRDFFGLRKNASSAGNGEER